MYLRYIVVLRQLQLSYTFSMSRLRWRLYITPVFVFQYSILVLQSLSQIFLLVSIVRLLHDELICTWVKTLTV